MSKYKHVAELVLTELRSRCGMDIDLDDETVEDIIQSLAKIIEENV